ncbi:MAG: PH domain-containing protein [Eubacteriales bacterium]|nr:PH domain-containing protein [Eubacteriales bacterium]
MEQNKFRCHYSIVFENMGRFLVICFVAFLGQANNMSNMVQDIMRGDFHLVNFLAAFGIVFVVLLLCFLYQNIVWAKTWISIEEDAIVLERRTINRKKNTIGIKNISNINLEQNIFERIMNTYVIKLDTNSRTTADKTDVRIVLGKEKAEWFRCVVMERMQKAAGEKEATAQNAEEMNYDIVYSPKQIIMHCVYTASVSAVLIILTAIIVVIVALRLVRTGTLLLDGIANAIGGLTTAAIILYSVAQSLIKDFFVYYNFRVKRVGDKIHLEHGLLKKRKYILAVDKINAVRLVSPLVSRVCKRQFVELICVGVGDENKENSMLLLAETEQDMREKLAVLLPEFHLEQGEIHKRSKASIWSELPRKVCYYAILIVLMVVVGHYNVFHIPVEWGIYVIYVVGVFLIGTSVLNLFMAFYTQGICLLDRELLLVNGCFEKKITWIPYYKIQQISYEQGPIRRKCKLATGMVRILAKMIDSAHPVTYLEQSMYEEIGKRILQSRGKMD